MYTVTSYSQEQIQLYNNLAQYTVIMQNGDKVASELSNVNTLAANSATAGDRHRKILLCITHLVLRIHGIRWSIRAWIDRVV